MLASLMKSYFLGVIVQLQTYFFSSITEGETIK